MSDANPGAPAGWYPDPSGADQWRVWTGERWSDVVRAYHETPRAPLHVGADALDHLRRFGVLATFGGLGLLVSSLAHWPGTASAESTLFALTASDVAMGLLVVGVIIYALAARRLDGRWSPAALTPGLNVFYVGARLAQRTSGRSPVTRVVTEVALLALFVTQGHAMAWLALAPVLVGLGHLGALEMLRESDSLGPVPAS